MAAWAQKGLLCAARPLLKTGSIRKSFRSTENQFVFLTPRSLFVVADLCLPVVLGTVHFKSLLTVVQRSEVFSTPSVLSTLATAVSRIVETSLPLGFCFPTQRKLCLSQVIGKAIGWELGWAAYRKNWARLIVLHRWLGQVGCGEHHGSHCLVRR